MNGIKIISSFIAVSMISGCSYTNPELTGAMGPKVTTSGRTDTEETYVEVGVEFTTMGDFIALVNPRRWASPFETGGTFSWLNPGAWADDAGRTARVLIGEAVVIGGAAAIISGGGGNGSSGNGGPPAPDGDGGNPPTIKPDPPVPGG